MALGGIIVDTNDKINPLKHGNNAIWRYQWISVDTNQDYCVLMAFIPIVPRDVPLAKPENLKWVKLEESFISSLPTSHELGRIECMQSSTGATLRKVLGDSIFSRDLSFVIEANEGTWPVRAGRFTQRAE